jgi:methyl-accepting chemotaxis protein
MKIKFKLSFLVIAVMAAVVSVISILLLRQSSALSVGLTLQSVENLAGQRAEYWKGREEGNLLVLRTLANVMASYEDMAPETRRDRFDNILKGTLAANPNMITLYTIWKPNAIDGMDEQFIGHEGSSPTGQYAITYSRESGNIRSRTSGDIESTMQYFNSTKTRNDIVESPFLRNINGEDKFLFRMKVPIINPRTDEVVGIVGCLLNPGLIQPILERVIHDNEEITIMVIYSNNGFVLGHVFPDRINKYMLDVDVEFGKHRHEVFKAIQEGKDWKGKIFDPTFGTNVELVLKSFKISNSDMSWSILIGTAESYMLKDVKKMTKYTVILAITAIIASAAAVFIFLGFITKPIVKVTETLKDISEGEGDLTKLIPENGNDEIADLSRYFNKTIVKIKDLIVSIKRQAVLLSDTGNELAGNMTQTAASVNEITENIQEIKGKMLSQSASVTETGATMEQITLNIDKLNNFIEKQTSSVHKSSSSIEEMLANIGSVTKTLQKNEESVKDLNNASGIGRTGLQNMAQDIKEIASDSEGLVQINSVIENIASQTNLLSMNAAIEAAHAGDAGKGFAVVAEEIRKLAESSSEQSRTIRTVLKKIKSSIDKISESAGSVIMEFEAIDTGVKTVAEQENSILHAMQEQNEGGKLILDAVGELNQISHQVLDGSAQIHEGSKEVIRESKNLEAVTEDITGRINEMAAGAQQINISVNRVNDISVQNKDNIESLVREVSRFRVE